MGMRVQAVWVPDEELAPIAVDPACIERAGGSAEPTPARQSARPAGEAVACSGGGEVAVQVRNIFPGDGESLDVADAQADFGEVTVVLNGAKTKVAFFVITLPYSDAIFCQVFPKECTETFQEGHRRAFEFFGGVPHRISYDNSKIAVLKIVGGRGREATREHIHTVVRTPNGNDYGKDLLRQHLEAHPH